MVTKFLPLPDNNGGRQRSLAIARRLAGLGDVVLCGYDDGSADSAGLRDLGLDVRAVPWRVTPVGVARGVARTQSVSAGRFWSAAMLETVRRAAAESSVDLLQVEYQQLVPFVARPAGQGLGAGPPQRRVGSRRQLRRRPARGPRRPAPRRSRSPSERMERKTIGEFDHVVVVSEEEKVRLNGRVRSVLVCPNGREPTAVLPEAPRPPWPSWPTWGGLRMSTLRFGWAARSGPWCWRRYPRRSSCSWDGSRPRPCAPWRGRISMSPARSPT